MPTLTHIDNLELIQIFKKTRKMHLVVPLGKYALKIFQEHQRLLKAISFTFVVQI
jgi:ribonuclease D